MLQRSDLMTQSFQELTEEIFHVLNANEGLYQWIAQSPILLPQAAQTYYKRFRGFPYVKVISRNI